MVSVVIICLPLKSGLKMKFQKYIENMNFKKRYVKVGQKIHAVHNYNIIIAKLFSMMYAFMLTFMFVSL
jgi:hypothetical protein